LLVRRKREKERKGEVGKERKGGWKRKEVAE
jgi:hypothetical protein